MKDNRFDEREPYVPISEDMADNDLLEEYEAQLAEKKAKQKAKQRGAAAPVQSKEPLVQQAAAAPVQPVPPLPEEDNPKPPIYKQWWFWVIIGVVVVGMIVAIVLAAGKKDDKEVSQSSSNTTMQTTTEYTTEQTTYVSTTEEQTTQETTTQQQTTTQEQTTQEQTTQEDSTDKTTEDEDDRESRYNYALEKAKSLSSLMHMSRQGIYNELVSSGGENLAEDAAQYAIDHLKANYKANALTVAEEYSMQGMDEDSIYEKLVNEDLFTESEADYAVSHM